MGAEQACGGQSPGRRACSGRELQRSLEREKKILYFRRAFLVSKPKKSSFFWEISKILKN
jgi:hypothetical protein